MLCAVFDCWFNATVSEGRLHQFEKASMIVLFICSVSVPCICISTSLVVEVDSHFMKKLLVKLHLKTTADVDERWCVHTPEMCVSMFVWGMCMMTWAVDQNTTQHGTSYCIGSPTCVCVHVCTFVIGYHLCILDSVCACVCVSDAWARCHGG